MKNANQMLGHRFKQYGNNNLHTFGGWKILGELGDFHS